MDEIVGLGDVSPTFGGLTASDFASRVAGSESTEGDGLLEYNIYDQGDYSRNVASLSCESLANNSGLAGSSQPDARLEIQIFTTVLPSSLPVVFFPGYGQAG